MNNADKQYLDLLREVKEKGIKKSDRTGTGTVSLFGRTLRFNMQEGFPLLTTKKIHTKSVIHELLWFLQGSHNIKYLVDNGVNIWNEWPWQNYMKNHEKLKKMLDVAIRNADHGVEEHAELVDKIRRDLENNPSLTLDEFVAKIKESEYNPMDFFNPDRLKTFAEQWGELGPVYGKQWRQWQGWMKYEDGDDREGHGSLWYDQILRLIQDLKTNPDSRRLMVNAWNVAEIDQMLLPPCHYGFQCWTRELTIEERYKAFSDKHVDPELKENTPESAIGSKWTVKGFESRIRVMTGMAGNDAGEAAKNIAHKWLDDWKIPRRAISLMWQQRSVDLFLGLPFNIASYGLLLEMIAQSCNMIADELIFNGGDCHIYTNHFDQVDEQLKREPMELCKLKLTKPESEYSSLHGNNGHIIEYDYKNFEFIGYKSHPAIKAPIAI